MKKVWILEKFESREDMESLLAKTKDMASFFAGDSDASKTCAQMMNVLEKKIQDNPNGHWSGFEGKVDYKQFLDRANAVIQRNPGAKFRVVEGVIDDDAVMWLGYKATAVNDGVLRYLMATK